MSSPAPRKRKNLEDERDTFLLRNHSVILTQPFVQIGDSFLCYLYKVKSAPLFGVLLPISFPENSILEYIDTCKILLSTANILRNFQQELWCDLFRSSRDQIGSISEANYFVILLSDKSIDWTSILRAVKLKPLLKLNDYLITTRTKLILKTGYKSNATWVYISEFSNNTGLHQFFEQLYGNMYPGLQDIVSVYSGYDPIDILFDEAFMTESVAEFRKFLKSGLIKNFNENSILVFAKQTKCIKHQPGLSKKNNSSFPRGTPILISDLVYVFYLTTTHWDQGRTLLTSLLEMENLSYLLEFSSIYEYQGDLNTLKEACQAPSLDTNFNYESLETLGDTVLKTVYTLHIYLNTNMNEYKLTRKRGWKVSNRFLAQLAYKHNLYVYLKCKALKTNSFRPAYYTSKDLPNETYFIEHKITESMLADFVEALIGVFYITGGVLSASKFMRKFGILNKEGWDVTVSYFTGDPLSVITKKDLENFPLGPFKISELVDKPDEMSLSCVFDYKFNDKLLLEKALTHCTKDEDFNYERLEFLGDAIIDLIILDNIWTIEKLDPECLTSFKHEIVSNNTLAKISFITGLYRLMNIDRDIKNSIESFYRNTPWNDDMYSDNDIVLDMPKCLGDIFESVVAAVLIDSNSLNLTCAVFGCVFSNMILYLLKNKFRFKKRIIARLCELMTGRGNKIEFKEYEIEDIFCVQVFIDDQFVCEEFGETLKNAKDKASLAAYKIETHRERLQSHQFF
jgi:dsRNA-specific ribonuclease